MKRIAIIFVASLGLFFVTSCKVQKHGLVLMTDQSYRPTVLATNKNGFGSPDGIISRDGKLYLADEGGVAMETWSQSEGLKSLAVEKFGFLSPEDLVMDRDGNIFFTDDDAGGVWGVDKKGNLRELAGKD